MKALTITDNHNRRGLIIEKTDKPDEEWLAGQSIAPSTLGDWYTVYPLSGGAVIVNTDDMREIKVATAKEINTTINNANAFAKVALINKLS